MSLWSSVGKRLATSTNKTASGWQAVILNMPGLITASTIYVASCHTPGYYTNDINYFNAADSNGVLHAPVGAGVYAYGTSTS